MIPIEEIDKLLELANGITPGEWELWTGCSWRRIGSSRGESIVEPTKQSDGHPDLWFRQGFDGPDARCMLALPRFVAALRSARDALVQQQADAVDARRWQPIETAPKDGRTLLLGTRNALGNWRTMRGQWFSQDAIAEWENDECEEGWYETTVECDDDVNCWRTFPTHWMPLLNPPAEQNALAKEQSNA